MSDASQRIAAILFIVIPSVEYGGYMLLRYLTRDVPGYMDNPKRRSLFAAGHAHAGVLVVLTLVALYYVDQAELSAGWKTLVRDSFALAPILIPAGMFLSIASPRATAPNRLIALVYLGALSLMIGAVTLGVGLLRATT